MSSYGGGGPNARTLDTLDYLNEENGSENTSEATQRTPQPVGYAALSNQSVVDNSVSPSSRSRGKVLWTRESLHSSAQQLIAEINEKRRRDSQFLSDFRKSLDMQVTKSCAVIEQRMYATYERQGKVIQSKLQELFATLDRVAQLENELLEFKQGLQVLYQEVQNGD